MGGRIGYPVAMRPLPCLLRILLCLALLANGTAAAFANARMASEAVAGQGAAPLPRDGDDARCAARRASGLA